ncbi:DNA cross-link repair 1A protein-like [Teleopsis dalmanni]|uniref:DNA cross-link repair 1A protein-like n=1 Tax=Teleopsis dalmanni TaxID=139649 RepID=UPI0018CCA5D7|nr:DNA cross-link repair 1A protein-like [Teleopsis dalmanni]
MEDIGRLKIRSISELIEVKVIKQTKADKSAKATRKKSTKNDQNNFQVSLDVGNGNIININTPLTNDKKIDSEGTITKKPRTKKKELPPSQTRINSYFKSSTKNFVVNHDLVPTTFEKENKQVTSVRKNPKRECNVKRKGRKRLFVDDTESDATTTSAVVVNANKPKRKTPVKLKAKIADNAATTTAKKAPVRSTRKKSATKGKETSVNVVDCIDLCTDEESNQPLLPLRSIKSEPSLQISANNTSINQNNETLETKLTTEIKITTQEKTSNLNPREPMVSIEVYPDNYNMLNGKEASDANVLAEEQSNGKQTRKRKPRVIPNYKTIEHTTFAVDAFQFGKIPGVTHYFLTHFHADHYVGLTKKFAMPLYVTPITRRLVQKFIGTDEKYLHELELGVPQTINDVEVTAINANHCPGAMMLVFKLTDGKCILHTGDFRACAEMESEPIYWNNDIDTIYLDTTYLNTDYALCPQHESIYKTISLIEEFQQRNMDKRILYVVGTYVIGKEKFWCAVANHFDLKVWADPNRRKALDAMQIQKFTSRLCDNPCDADMHVIPLGQTGYLKLYEYFRQYNDKYDILLGLRPSGWEISKKPQYGKLINIFAIEYSEHSSYFELERFVKFLKPKKVISTVPTGHGNSATPNVPEKWYKYKETYGSMQRKFQTSITTFLKPKIIDGKNKSFSNKDSSNMVVSPNHSKNSSKSGPKEQDVENIRNRSKLVQNEILNFTEPITIPNTDEIKIADIITLSSDTSSSEEELKNCVKMMHSATDKRLSTPPPSISTLVWLSNLNTETDDDFLI